MFHAPCSTRAVRPLQAALALLLAASAQAATVYRCGSAYQDHPCEGGRVVDVADERSDEQQREQLARTQAERQQARALVAERRQREREQHPQTQAVGVNVPALRVGSSAPPPPADPCAKGAQRASKRAARPRCQDGQPLYQPLKPAAAPAR